jgi:hypothetical protein
MKDELLVVRSEFKRPFQKIDKFFPSMAQIE